MIIGRGREPFILVTALGLVCTPAVAVGLEAGAAGLLKSGIRSPAPSASPVGSEPRVAGSTSAAERIGRLEWSLEEDRKLLETIREWLQELKAPDSGYERAATLFQKLDQQMRDKQRELDRAKQSGDAEQLESIQRELDQLKRQWQLAKDAFEVEIKNQRVLQAWERSLAEKIARDQQALELLLGTSPRVPPGESKPVAPAGEAVKEQGPRDAKARLLLPGWSFFPSLPAPAPGHAEAPPQPSSTGPAATPTVPGQDEKVQQVTEEVEQLRAARDDLERHLQALQARWAATLELLQHEEEALRTARQRHTTAHHNQTTLERTLRQRLMERIGVIDPRRQQELDRDIQRLNEQVTMAEAHVREALQLLEQLEEPIDRHRRQLQELQEELARATAERQRLDEQLEAAERRAYWTQKVWQLLGLRTWLLKHGPRLLGILLGALLLWWLTRSVERRIVDVAARTSVKEQQEERLNRARTLAAFFRNVAQLVIFGGAGILILSQFGLDLSVMLGGAAITGLAAAFAGQNLLRDYFSGFVTLLENQYGVNDVVRIGDVAGVVEQVTLRLTVLRDLDGTVHFIPNGQITRVSNLTHGWSRAVFDIEVSYKEDLDRVMEVLLELARQMRDDPIYGPLILEDPEMLGVDEFRQSGVSIKFFIKTKPLKQWVIKRELNRRIKRKFDELGIEIPFPHRLIYHRFAETEPAVRLLAEVMRRIGHEQGNQQQVAEAKAQDTPPGPGQPT
jgi:small-conductance mechanosensitive channel